MLCSKLCSRRLPLTQSLLLLLSGLIVRASAQEAPRSQESADLARRAKSGSRPAILEAGKLGDKSLIPELEAIANPSGPSHVTYDADVSDFARMALARLGVRKEFERIASNLTSEDPDMLRLTIWQLEYIGDKRAISALISLLEDTKPRPARQIAGPNGERPIDARRGVIKSFSAMDALTRMAPNPPIRSDRAANDKEKRTPEWMIPIWKRWWETVGSKLPD